MSIFPTAALITAQYTKLRGDGSTTPKRYSASAYVSLCPNAVALKTTVAPMGYPPSYVQIAVGSTISGAIANCENGMTVLVSRTDDITKAYAAFRLRSATTGILTVNETSVVMNTGDYLWVLYDYRVWPKLARVVNGVYYKDYDQAFAQLPPVVVGLQTAYAGWVDGTGNLRIAFDVSSSYAATSGASISSYAWTLPAGASVVSGSTSAAAVTVDFPASAGVWVKVLVTDSGSRVATRRCIVFPHSNDYPPALGVEGIQVQGDLQNGWSASMTAFADVEDVPDNTLACVWTQEYYNDAEGAILATTNNPRNVVMVGRLRTENNVSATDATYSVVNEARLRVEGVAEQLARLHSGLIAMTNVAAPTVWDEINDLTPWRAVVHLLREHSTFLDLHDLTFDDTANTFECAGIGVQQDNLLGAVNDIGESINAALEFAPGGAARLVRNAAYLSSTTRNALTTVAGWTNADYLGLDLALEHVDTVGRVTGDGGVYNAGVVTPFLGIAPGVAQNYASGQSSLNRQILTAASALADAQTELNTRLGHHLAATNRRAVLSVQHPDGYGFLTPSAKLWYTWTLNEDETNIRGRNYTTSERWLLTRVTMTYDNAAGTQTVQAEYIAETTGDPGQAVVVETPTETAPDPITDLPPDDIYPGLPPDPIDGEDPSPIDEVPSGGTEPPTDGNSVMAWTATNLYLTRNFLSASPTWMDATPSDIIDNGYTIVHCQFDLRFNKRAYVLAQDTDSAFVYSTEDVFAGTPTWTTGTALSSLYTLIRCTSSGPTLAAYCPDTSAASSGAWSYTWNFKETGSALGWTAWSSLPSQGATLGVGYGALPVGSTGSDYAYFYSPAFTSSTLTSVVVKLSSAMSGSLNRFIAQKNRTSWDSTTDSNNPGIVTKTFSTPSEGGTWASTTRVFVGVEQGGASDVWAGVESVTLNGTGTNPFDPSANNAAVAFSGDGGETFAPAVSVGASPGLTGGFDMVRVGAASFAGMDNEVKAASSLGGAYASTTGGGTGSTQPVLILVPWFDWASDTATNYDAPYNWLLGADGLDSSHCLWTVTGGGTKTGITPSGATAMVGPDCATTWKGKKMAVIASVSGTRKLFTTTNAGSAWTDRGAVNAASSYIRVRRLSSTGSQLYFNSAGNVGYSGNFGASITYKAVPTGTVLGVEAYG